MRCDEKKESDIGNIGIFEGLMNKRFVAVSAVTGSRIRGCFSKPKRDFNVSRGWQQTMLFPMPTEFLTFNNSSIYYYMRLQLPLDIQWCTI